MLRKAKCPRGVVSPPSFVSFFSSFSVRFSSLCHEAQPSSYPSCPYLHLQPPYQDDVPQVHPPPSPRAEVR